MTLPEFDTGWMAIFGALLWCVLLGKAIRQETRVLTVALIAAVLTESWVGVWVAPIIVMASQPIGWIKWGR